MHGDVRKEVNVGLFTAPNRYKVSNIYERERERLCEKRKATILMEKLGKGIAEKKHRVHCYIDADFLVYLYSRTRLRFYVGFRLSFLAIESFSIAFPISGNIFYFQKIDSTYK